MGCQRDSIGTTIDTPEPARILAEAEAKNWRLTQIWNTHWHPDHAGGNAELKQATGARITGPAEVERIGLAPDRIVAHGDVIKLGAHAARVIDVGGHTLGHVAFIFDADKIGFVGDALFSLGCGRMFEGTPQQFWTSLKRIDALPADMTLYCAHEYTAANARFALSVDPDNERLRARADEIARLRAENKPTVPMRLELERATNPFLRAPRIARALGVPFAADYEAFAEIRRRKDEFS
jgi:hydroxyacylglutathione hydrolase